MNLRITFCFISVLLTSIECGVLKNFVETTVGEVTKVAGVIENAITKKITNTTEEKPTTEQILKNDTKKYIYEGNVEKQTVSTEAVISEVKNSNFSEQKYTTNKNNPLQVNVDITVIINYGNKTVSSKDLGPVSVPISTDNNRDEQLGKDKPNNSIIKITSTEPNRVVTLDNVTEQNLGALPTIVGPTINSNIIFPGPTKSPAYEQDGAIIVETNDDITNIDQVLFPDNSRLNLSITNITSGCPKGLVMTEKGYCLQPIDGEENKKNAVTKFSGRGKSAFVGGCIFGFARALDGSCQEVIYD